MVTPSCHLPTVGAHSIRYTPIAAVTPQTILAHASTLLAVTPSQPQARPPSHSLFGGSQSGPGTGAPYGP
jgi:hypothetical protein